MNAGVLQCPYGRGQHTVEEEKRLFVMCVRVDAFSHFNMRGRHGTSKEPDGKIVAKHNERRQACV